MVLSKGQVYVTSWGYDQTNYDFIVIEDVSKTGKTVKCKMARLASNESKGSEMEQVPSSEGYGETFQMCVRSSYNGSIALKGSYPFCGNSKRMDMFSPVIEGKKYYETAQGWGH